MFSGFFNNSQRVPFRTFFARAPLVSLYKALRRSESLSLYILMKWKRSNTMLALGRFSRTAAIYAGDISMASAFRAAYDLLRRLKKGVRISASLPSPTTNTAPVHRLRTTVR